MPTPRISNSAGLVVVLLVIAEAACLQLSGLADMGIGSGGETTADGQSASGGSSSFGGAGGSGVGGSADGSTPQDASLCDANLNEDQDNCGRCNHSCQGGACKDGLCQPVKVASLVGLAKGFATDANSVYWTETKISNDGGLIYDAYVHACAHTGCTLPTALGHLSGYWAGDLAINVDSIYWLNEALEQHDGKLAKCPLSGCTAEPEILKSYVWDPGSISLNASTLFFSDLGQWSEYNPSNWDAEILTCPLAGCTTGTTTLAEHQYGAFAMTVDSNNIYWAGTLGYVWSCPLSGCSGSPTVVTQQLVYDMVVEAATLYATSMSGILQCALPACPEPTILASCVGAPSHLAVDSTHVYWTQKDKPAGKGTVRRCLRSGCGDSPEVLVVDQYEPSFLALTDTSVYWTTEGEGSGVGAVLKVAK